MKLAFHQITSGAGRDLADTFKAYSDAGWRHFEVNFSEVGPFIEKNGIDAVLSLMKDNGLECAGATGLSISAFKGDAALAADIEQIKVYGEWMQAMGAGAIVCGGETPEEIKRNEGSSEAALSARDTSYREALKQFADAAGTIADAAAPFGVRLAMEVNWVGLCRSIRTMAELVKLADRGNIGAVWDPAHFASTPSRIADLDLLDGKIFHAHLNDIRDCPFEVMDINGDRVIPGDGILPMREWSDKVTSLGYDGYHCLELFSDDIWAMSVQKIAKVTMAGCLRVWPDARF